MTVTARINVETPAGSKIVRELEKHRIQKQITILQSLLNKQ